MKAESGTETRKRGQGMEEDSESDGQRRTKGDDIHVGKRVMKLVTFYSDFGNS